MFFTHLLYNLLVNITPILLYQLFWLHKLSAGRRLAHPIAIAVIGSATSLLCMLEPFSFQKGLFYDLRFIPVIVAYLYGGTFPGIAVSAVMFLYRASLGGDGLLLTGIVILILTPMFIAGAALFRKQSAPRNIVYAAFIGLIGGLVPTMVALVAFWQKAIDVNGTIFVYFAVYTVLHSITAGLVVWIIEQIKINIRVQEKLQHIDKINLLSELAASFAHEIRNPLTVARGFLQMMQQANLGEDKKKLFTTLALDEINKSQSIIKDYMTFARPQLEVQEAVDVGGAIRQAIQSLQSYAELHRVNIEVVMEDKLTIHASKEKFSQCIVNMSKNGIESMPDGGKLLIVGSLQNRQVCLDFIDEGVGMSPEELSRLGTPYYSTKLKGTGISMMVTYRIIQMLNGKIEVTSEVGKGTCFSISIPSISSASFH